MKALERRLGLGGVFGPSVSAMLGPGAFIVPGVAIHGAGGLAWLTYIVAALIILPTAFAKSELASAMPRSGGALRLYYAGVRSGCGLGHGDGPLAFARTQECFCAGWIGGLSRAGQRP